MLHNLITQENEVETTQRVLNTTDFEFNPMKMIKVDISGYWRYAQFIGTERLVSKKGTKGWKEFGDSDKDMGFLDKNHNDWNKNDFKSHHIGLFGELAYALELGLQPDMELRQFGDGNKDFDGGIDIKSTFLNNKTMSKYVLDNCYKKGLNQISKYYVKANINLETKEVILVGWISGEDLINNGIIQNYGKGNKKNDDNGDRYVIHYSDLNPMHTLPPFIKAKYKQIEKMQDIQKKFMLDVYKNNN